MSQRHLIAVLCLCLTACPSDDANPTQTGTGGSSTGTPESTSGTATTAEATTEATTHDASTGSTSAETTGSTGEPPSFEPSDPQRPVVGDCPDEPAVDAFVQCVDSFDPNPEAEFNHEQMPDIVLGPPEGPMNPADGSLDVVSLGCDGQITLDFGPDGIPDVDGVDFIVFENPLDLGEETFAEPAEVYVSPDGTSWSVFACALDEGWPPSGCAGINSVFANSSNGLATDADQAGGDAFDLSDLGLAQIRYIRLVDRSVAFYGDRSWCGPTGGFDLDAVAKVDPA